MTENICLQSRNYEMDAVDMLLVLVEGNYVKDLKEFLSNEDADVNHKYKKRDFKTILQMACYDFDAASPETVQLLLDYGADPLYMDNDYKMQAIHFAAMGGNVSKLRVVLKYLNDRNVNLRRCTALLKTLRHMEDFGKKESDYLDIIEELLDTDIDINLKFADEDNETAIYLAASFAYKEVINSILKKSFNKVDLDSYKDSDGKTARDLITESSLYFGDLPRQLDENDNITINTLHDNICDKKADQFKSNYEALKADLTLEDRRELFYQSARYGLHELMKLFKDVDQNDPPPGKDTPFVIACQYGYHLVIKDLGRRDDATQKNISDGLQRLLSISYTASKDKLIDFDKSFEVIMKNKKMNVNSKFGNGFYPLHFAARYKSPEQCLEILRRGASLSVRDDHGVIAVADMKPDVLKTHLDECISCSNENDDVDRCIEINLNSLLPPRLVASAAAATKAKDAAFEIEKGNNDNEFDQCDPETDVVHYIGASTDHRHLLTHPVIMTFLYMKWLRINSFFYINLGVYFLFFASLLCYVLLEYTNISSRMNTNGFVTNCSFAILIVTTIILCLREIFQMVIFKIRYLEVPENWIEMTLFAIVLSIIAGDLSETVKRQLSAAAIVLAATELLLLMGHIPELSTNIMVLRTVSFTFFKLLSWYSILLVAFALSFFMLFQEDEKSPADGEGDNVEDDDEQNFFLNPLTSLLKTLVMLTGELEAGELKFNNFPIVSHLIFVSFVFLITIVLFNLLNGLAVSDTQLIKSDAELYGQILRVEHIAQVERILLSFKKLRNANIIRKICLFPDSGEQARLEYYPKQNHRIVCCDDDGGSNCWSRISLEAKLRRKIKNAMEEIKRDNESRAKEEHREKEMREMKEMLMKLTAMKSG